jgi:pyruvate,orthophosphate dikinase
VTVEYKYGTMIELPRAALLADELAQTAEFFSFGTNDLTQTTLGMSRDDAGKFLPEYVDKKILKYEPFVSIDQEGVGQLVKMGCDKGKQTAPTSASASAASTAATPTRSTSSSAPVSSTSAAARSACRSLALRRLRRHLITRRSSSLVEIA